jgi:hypothetical protein
MATANPTMFQASDLNHHNERVQNAIDCSSG